MQSGDIIGAYEVVTQLQSGGMATLWLARRRGAAGFTRPVVVKVIHPHLASDDDFVSMFVDEAKIAARIDHPNVVHVEELNEEEGRLYLVMEYIHGVSLAELAKALRRQRRAMSPTLATAIAIRVADGLHAAHETCDDTGQLLHVVHRDVSPHNVLISYRGHVKVIDFGVAKARGRSIQTQGGSLKGKIRYMCPEQASGQHVDRRADIYSLGVVLWELLTQRPLFRAESEIELISMVRAPIVRPPRELNPAVPRALEEAILRALAISRDARPATARELKQLLTDAVPDAAGLDATRIADLVHATVGDLVATRAEALRTSAPGLAIQTTGEQPALSRSAASEVLENFTISVDLSEPSAVRIPGGRPLYPGLSSDSVLLAEAAVPARRGRPVVLTALAVLALVGGGAAVVAAWPDATSPAPSATTPLSTETAPPVANTPETTTPPETVPTAPDPEAPFVQAALDEPDAGTDSVEAPEDRVAAGGHVRPPRGTGMVRGSTAMPGSRMTMGGMGTSVPIAGADEF